MVLRTQVDKKQTSIIKEIRYYINNNKEPIRFLLLFMLCSLTFFIFYFLLQDSLNGLLFFTAQTVGMVSNAIGLSVVVEGVFIEIGTMTFEIIHECTGIFAIAISLSSIIAYPTQWKQKTIGILFVIPFILFLNLIRILFLIYIGKYHMGLFEMVHAYLWQGTFIIFIILAWFLWIELVVKHA